MYLFAISHFSRISRASLLALLNPLLLLSPLLPLFSYIIALTLILERKNLDQGWGYEEKIGSRSGRGSSRGSRVDE
jgi:hypothetical protein